MPHPCLRRTLIAAIIGAALSGCVTMGTQDTAVTGSAGGQASLDANSALERCEQPLGTLAVDDGRGSDWYGSFGDATNVTTVEPLIRLAVQQSNCFVITSVGSTRTDSRLSRITDLQRNSGEYRAGSNQRTGQRVAADYFLEPRIVIDDSPTGKVGAVLGGLVGGAFGVIAGGLETRASVVTLTLFDIRSAIQLAASEGSATSTNYGAAVGAFVGGAAGGFGGLSETPEGKATVAAFVDAYNGLILALKQYEAQDVEGGLGTGGTLDVN